MPTYEITSPDGRKFRVTAPEGASQQEVLAYAQANAPKVAAQQEASEGVGPAQAAMIAAGRWLDKKAGGLRELAPESVRNALDTLNAKLGMGELPAIGAQREVDEKAFQQLADKQKVATFLGELAPSMMAPNPLAMGALAAVEPGAADERVLRGMATYGAGKAGEWVGGKAADAFGKMAANRAAQRAAPSVRDATIREAQGAGYVIPPEQIKSTVGSNLLTGFGGKIKTQQYASAKNEPVTASLAKRAIGIADDIELTPASIGQVRSTAGSIYEQVKKLGPMQVDKPYDDAIAGVLGEYRSLVKEFPSQANGAIESLAKDLSKPEFSSGGIVELVKRLRFDGFRNIKAREPEKVALGRIQVKAQEALEDLIDRTLEREGLGMSLEAFRKARVLIAKTHTVENALEESTGKIVASKIGREFASGKPLTGELATIGKMAEAFPKAMQNVNTTMPAFSPLDFATGAISGAAGGWPWAPLMFARPAARVAALSGPYQRSLSGAAPSMGEKLMALAGRNPDELEKLGALSGGLLGLRAFP